MDIHQYVAADGCHFSFPMDAGLSPALTLNWTDQLALYSYSNHVSNDLKFVPSVLQILIEERQSTHHTRYNIQREANPYKVEDVINMHVQVRSNSITGTVKKNISNSGPFSNQKIIRC